MRRPLRVSPLLAAATVLAAAGAAPAIDVAYHPLVASGDPIPGVPGRTFIAGTVANSADPAVINSRGRFVAMFPVAPTRTAVIGGDIRGASVELRVVLESGLPIASFGDLGLSTITRDLNIDAEGRVVGGGLLSGAGVNSSSDEAWWVEPSRGGPPQILVREGQPAPGLPGILFGGFNGLEVLPAVSDDGDLTFFTFLTGAGVTGANNAVLWRGHIASPAATTLLARTGEPVPGQAAGVTYAGFPAFAPTTLSASGECFIIATLAGPGFEGTGSSVLLRFAPGSQTPTIVARRGETIAGQYIYNFKQLSVSPSGGALLLIIDTGPFAGTLQPGAILQTTTDLTQPWRLVMAAAEQAPGLPNGVMLGAPEFSGHTVARTGAAAFTARLDGPGVTSSSNTAAHSEKGGGPPTLLVRRGVLDPIAPPGTSFTTFSVLDLNARGETLATARISGATTSTDDLALAMDAGGARQVLFHEGQPLTLSPDDTRTVFGFAPMIFSPRRLDDAGHFLCNIWFSANSRALVLGALDPCPGDHSLDGQVTLQDLFDFLTDWFGGHDNADLNRDSTATLQDLFDFLTFWFAGCA